MNKKHFALITVAIVFAFAFYWLSRKALVTQNPNEIVSSTHLDQLHHEDVLPAPREVQSVENDEGELQESKTSEEQACWNKIEASSAAGRDQFINRVQKKTKNIVGGWIYEKELPILPGTEISASDLFLRGAALSGQLWGREVPVENAEIALEMLLKASELDKTNSAPLLFAAALENKRGRSKEALALIERANSDSNHYNSYLGRLAQEAYHQVRKSSDVVSAIAVVASLPSLDFSEVQKILIENKSYDLALQLTVKGSDQEKMSELEDFDPIEYAIGYHVLKSGGVQRNLPTLKQIIDFRRDNNYFTRSGTEDKILKSCDINDLEGIVDFMKNYKFNF